jgi:trehalose-6-phosphate synthase
MKPDVKTLFFWHIPWPTYDIFRIMPQKNSFIENLLSYDLTHPSSFAAQTLREV